MTEAGVAGADRGAQAAYDAAYYAANGQEGDRVALWFYARVAARLAPRGATALDFGCGTGHLSRRLATRFRSIAFDPSPSAREATARVSPRSRVVASLDEVREAEVDLVVALHVLEHLPDPSVALERFAALLRPGGRLLFVVPNPDGWGHRMRGEAWFAYRDPTHCSLLPAAEWLGRTRRAGLAVERARSDGLWDPPYVARLPRRLQLALLGAPAAVQVAFGRLLLPRDWGECLVVVARR